ncbi:MAG: hypothetical protein II979_02695 [Clostridia bacterium]|nr:hypothetical protein [Clostridia bacterium]
MKNGTPYLDIDGNGIHAHGGYILQHEGWYYWYGEDRRDNNTFPATKAGICSTGSSRPTF